MDLMLVADDSGQFLHQMARDWHAQRSAAATGETAQANRMPLVNDQEKHDRIREMPVGLNPGETAIGTPYQIPWNEHLASLKELGLPLRRRARRSDGVLPPRLIPDLAKQGILYRLAVEHGFNLGGSHLFLFGL